MLLLALHPALAGACSRPATPAELHRVLASTAVAYYALDQARFEDGLALVLARLGCLEDALDPTLAAELHRVVGLGAWLGRSSDRAAQAFAAARWSDPSWRFTPGTLAPETGERAVFEGITPGPPSSQVVPAPRRGTLSFDGVDGPARPLDRPTIVQLRTPDGEVLGTEYVWPDEALPRYAARRPVSPPALLAGAAGAMTLAGGIVVSIGGARQFDPNFRELSAFGDDSAAVHWKTAILPWYAVGGALAGLGGIGLAGAGVWVVTTEDGAAAGLSGTW